MNLSNCSRCGKVFARPPGSSDICPACVKENDDNYHKIFDFFTRKPTATAQEIADETGIDIKEIYRYVRENRLKLVHSDGLVICEACGAPISAGKICDDCRMKLAHELKENLQKRRQERPDSQKARKSIGHDPKHLKDRRGEK